MNGTHLLFKCSSYFLHKIVTLSGLVERRGALDLILMCKIRKMCLLSSSLIVCRIIYLLLIIHISVPEYPCDEKFSNLNFQLNHE